MKKIVLLHIFLFSSFWLIGQNTTVTIPSNGGNNGAYKPPFGIYDGHERSCAIYTRTEIGSVNNNIFIDTLRWSVATGNPNNYTIKIYLKTTNSTSVNGPWETNVAGATLVYDGNAYFPSLGWYTFDIADFVHSTYSPNNLMVLCETNWGGAGAFSNPTFFSSSTGTYPNSNKWWHYDYPPADSLFNKNRPLIKLTYLVLTGIIPPSAFMTDSVTSSDIGLKWKRITNGDNVLIAYNTTNTFGTPSGTYVVGNNIAGGGTVIYNGSDSTFKHTGLTANTTYYYMVWSVHSSSTYSTGTKTHATTLCNGVSMYPYITDFESTTYPPTCWSLDAVPWIRNTSASGFGAGAASISADFLDLGNLSKLDLFSPILNLNSMPFPVLKFDHAYATNTSQVDSLQLWISFDYGATFNWLTSWAGGVNGPLNTGGVSGSDPFIPLGNQWATKRYPLPAGTNQILLRGLCGQGNYLYLDNITIYDTACTTATIPYSEGFDNYTPPTTGCVKVTNNNGDNIKWTTSSSTSRSVPNSMYITHNITHKMADWFFTPSMHLTGGTTYTVDFYYNSGGAPAIEKMEVKWGNVQDSIGMTGGQIWNNANIQNTTYQEGSANFTPSTTGNYYVGWHGYSAANMSWICVDDIHIDIANVTWNGTQSEDWSDPLNWTPAIVPNGYQTVTILSGTDHDPVISTTGQTCKQLTIKNGVIMNLSNVSALTVNGNLTIETGATLNNAGVITVKGNLIK